VYLLLTMMSFEHILLRGTIITRSDKKVKWTLLISCYCAVFPATF